MMSSSEQIKGVLWGLVWGDVLGCPVETYRPQEIQDIYGVYAGLPVAYPVDRIKEEKKVKRLRPIGLYSDDGQQAMALLQVCLSENGWTPLKWKNMLVQGGKQKAWRGTGRYFELAVKKLAQGVSHENSGSPSAGIGAAMRVGIIGALCHGKLELLEKISVESSLMTHGDIRCGAFSYALCKTIADVINGIPIETIYQELPNQVRTVENRILSHYTKWTMDRAGVHQVSDALSHAFSKKGTIKEVRKAISDFAKPYLAEDHSLAHVNQGFVLTGGIHAIVCGLLAENPQDMLLSIMNLGYDTDTVAAICGGILGARFGESWIPKEKVVSRDRVEAYALLIAKETARLESQAEFLNHEASLTKKEQQFKA
jgi:ADP-ribosyl-[dinitrogen reductase] hydrolase